ncbi:CYFA0S15e01365g1_1 [Cyberlindnera fabianii]|uniref:CYFA0S15e01365g1_1 n=1 Tax=Cyberlindnera fabianii TaxID=36022 RepID=A0A061B4E8_CYBFA|nr:CYFA0S15e01365g1_1 [Cyberlindnera fabianii]
MFASHQSTITFLKVFIGNYRSFIQAQLITLLSTMRIPEFPGCGAAKKKKEYSNVPKVPGIVSPFRIHSRQSSNGKVTDPASPGFLFFSSTFLLELFTSLVHLLLQIANFAHSSQVHSRPIITVQLTGSPPKSNCSVLKSRVSTLSSPLALPIFSL